jgi:hypothetical protein
MIRKLIDSVSRNPSPFFNLVHKLKVIYYKNILDRDSKYSILCEQTTSSSSSSSLAESEDSETPFHPPVGILNFLSDSGTPVCEIPASVFNQTRLATVVAQLREIVGDDASQEQLEEVAVAADYDVNRAVNYFFSL